MKPFFKSASGELKAMLSERASLHMYHADEELFAVGDRADFLPIIVSGMVRMVQFPEVGKEVILDIFRDGQMFAVPPVIDGKSYPASAFAIEKTQILLLERRDFFEVLRESNEFTIAVLEWMSDMLRQKTATIRMLAGGTAEQRIAQVLVRLCDASGGSLPVKIALRREDIGKMTGLVTETVIRIVRRMKEKGLIRVERGKILVDESTGLRKLLS